MPSLLCVNSSDFLHERSHLSCKLINPSPRVSSLTLENGKHHQEYGDILYTFGYRNTKHPQNSHRARRNTYMCAHVNVYMYACEHANTHTPYKCIWTHAHSHTHACLHGLGKGRLRKITDGFLFLHQVVILGSPLLWLCILTIFLPVSPGSHRSPPAKPKTF